ncbi:hypothetical protein F6455_17915 [Proteobacteria bacterium 005FR1]|nr:hypothetical protein [Proteobacteria bacterium 005FR1]
MLKNAIKRCLLSAGLQIQRIDRKPEPAPVYDELSEAVKRKNYGEASAYRAPISKCTVVNGFSFLHDRSWHPFVEAMVEYIESGYCSPYSGSILERFYQTWKPKNSLQALIGAQKGPAVLSRYPAFSMHSPWLDIDPEERKAFMSRMIRDENRWSGVNDLDASHGYGLHGPVSGSKGEIEYRRLTSTLDSIRKHGYNRRLSGGDLTVVAIEKEGDYRFCIAHGQHRIAVMAALGEEHIPISINKLVHVSEIHHWPQVYRGIWSADEARAYIDHLFHFDAKAWASSMGLCKRASSPEQGEQTLLDEDLVGSMLGKVAE